MSNLAYEGFPYSTFLEAESESGTIVWATTETRLLRRAFEYARRLGRNSRHEK